MVGEPEEFYVICYNQVVHNFQCVRTQARMGCCKLCLRIRPCPVSTTITLCYEREDQGPNDLPTSNRARTELDLEDFPSIRLDVG